MSEARFRDVNGRVVQFADRIVSIGTVITTAAPTRINVRYAFALLDQRRYAEAAAEFRRVLPDEDDGGHTDFGLALALLQGVRPHRHSEPVIDRVLALLRDDVPEALMLAYLVVDDHGLHWRRVRSRKIPSHITTLASVVPPVSGRRILLHFPAREARGWRALMTAHADSAPESAS